VIGYATCIFPNLLLILMMLYKYLHPGTILV
jgi:hypothetical protein